MEIALSDHFTYKKLLKFTVPSIVMMLVNSVYGIVDGLFISNIVGKNTFAAVNFMIPVSMIVATIGFMIGTGGSALVGKTMGQKEDKKANELFTLYIFFAAILGLTTSIVGYLYMPEIAKRIGASAIILDDCILYGRVMMISSTFFILQSCFQNFMITAEKPQLGLIVTVIAGVGNMVCDFVLMYIFKMGILGAALATAMTQILGAVIPLIYFTRNKTSKLHFVKFSWDFKALLKGCTNGASEMLSNISRSLVGMLYNIQLMKMAGENGVAAYGVIMYISFIFIAIFLGFSFGTAPLFSYHFGAKNTNEMKNLFKKSIVIIGMLSIAMVVIGITFATPFTKIFVGYDAALFELTIHGLVIYSFSYFFTGFNIFASSFFTSLNNGLVSGILSVTRTLIFECGAILILPLFLKVEGIWLAIIVAEFLSLILSMAFTVCLRKNYQYI